MVPIFTGTYVVFFTRDHVSVSLRLFVIRAQVLQTKRHTYGETFATLQEPLLILFDHCLSLPQVNMKFSLLTVGALVASASAFTAAVSIVLEM